MKRQLIYHTHVITNRQQSKPVQVQTRLIGDNNSSATISCSLDRISRDGMTLSCDELTLNQLMPKKACVAPKNPITLVTDFSLDEKIHANCRVIYTRRLSKNQFVLELKFFELAERDMNLIDQFIEKCLNGDQHVPASTIQNTLSNAEAPSETSYQKPSLHHLKANSKAVFSKVA
jgi:hypothetical protein